VNRHSNLPQYELNNCCLAWALLSIDESVIQGTVRAKPPTALVTFLDRETRACSVNIEHVRSGAGPGTMSPRTVGKEMRRV
jgi:hypothetical protein